MRSLKMVLGMNRMYQQVCDLLLLTHRLSLYVAVLQPSPPLIGSPGQTLGRMFDKGQRR